MDRGGGGNHARGSRRCRGRRYRRGRSGWLALHVDADTHADSDSDTHADTDADADSDTHADADAHADAHADADADADTDADDDLHNGLPDTDGTPPAVSLTNNQYDWTITYSQSGASVTEVFATGGGNTVTASYPTGTVQSGLTRYGQANVQEVQLGVSASTDPTVAVGGGVGFQRSFAQSFGLTYVDFGEWSLSPSGSVTSTVTATAPLPGATPSSLPSYVGVFAGGQPGAQQTATPPTFGAGTYVGGAVGQVGQPNSTNANGTAGEWFGSLSLTMNFANAQVFGSITNIKVYPFGNSGAQSASIGTLNNLTFNGSQALSGSTYLSSFSGSIAADQTVGSAFDISGATGVMAGAFYGSGAQEVGGVFTLSGGANNVAVQGAFGGKLSAPTLTPPTPTPPVSDAGPWTSAQINANTLSLPTTPSTHAPSASGTPTLSLTTDYYQSFPYELPWPTGGVGYAQTYTVSASSLFGGVLSDTFNLSTSLCPICETDTSSNNNAVPPGLSETFIDDKTPAGNTHGIDLVNWNGLNLKYIQIVNYRYTDVASSVVSDTIQAVGSWTPVASMPGAGTASFNGDAWGTVLPQTGGVFQYTSGLSASVNFGTGAVTGSASNFVYSQNQAATSAPTPASNAFNFNFSGTIGAGSNVYQGALSGSGLSGALVGEFAGPSAQETGGTFNASGSAGSLIGGFAAMAPTSGALTTSYLASSATVTGSGSSLGLSNLQFGGSVSGSLSGNIFTDIAPTAGGTITSTFDITAGQSGLTRYGQSNVTSNNVTVTASTDPAITTSGVGTNFSYAKSIGLSYSDFGEWDVSASANAHSTYVGVYAGGQPGVAPTVYMPKTGEASYMGGAVGQVQQPNSTNPNGKVGVWYGTVGLNVTFNSGTLSGTISPINVYVPGTHTNPIGTLNTIYLQAVVTGSTLVGTAGAGTDTGSAFDIGGVTGPLKGTFYGPGGRELVGVFSMSGGKNNILVQGSFGVKAAYPSDRRLKTDIRSEGRLPNGLALYSWRYLASRTRYTGVMAQEVLANPRFADAVEIDPHGVMRVRYDRIGFIPGDPEGMARDGEAAVQVFLQTVH